MINICSVVRQTALPVVALCLFFNSFSHAQNAKGNILIAVSPDDAIIRLDTTLHKQRNSFQMLDTGTYVIRAWAPGRILSTDTIHLTSSKPFLYRKQLDKTPAYIQYQRDLRQYRGSRALTRYIPGAVTIGAAIVFALQEQANKRDADKYKEEALGYKAIYDQLTDAAQFDYYLRAYNGAKGRYDEAIDKANSNVKTAMIVVPTGIVVTGVLWYISKKFTRPVYEEIPALSGLSFDYRLTGPYTGPRVNYSLKF